MAIKNTQANQINYIKETRFDVISFNDNGTRNSTYGNLNPLQALAEMSVQSLSGKRVLLVPAGTKWQNSLYSQCDVNAYNNCLKVATKSEKFTR